ncbi:MAG: PEP-CTERM sorting domain-containing protein [Luteolibacter sp.]
MKKITTLLTVIASASFAQAATVTASSTTLLSSSQNGEGSAVIDLTTGSASAGGTSATTFTLGDGTVEEYAFVNGVGASNASGGSLSIYASSTTSISTPTIPAGTLNGSRSNVALTLPDGTTTFTTDTGAAASDASGTIDTSGYSSGTVYFIFGTSADFAQVAFGGEVSGFIGSEDSGDAFDKTGTAFTFPDQGTGSAGTLGANGTAIAAFTFDNTADSFADTNLAYRSINTDIDGSRAKIYGIVLDGVVVPEPSSSALVCLGLMIAAFKRRKG